MEKYISLDEQIVQFCKELCGRFAFMSEDWRTQVAVVMGALPSLLCDQQYTEQLEWLLVDAIEDVRTGRTNAEIENGIRDRKAEAAAQQNADDLLCKRADGGL